MVTLSDLAVLPARPMVKPRGSLLSILHLSSGNNAEPYASEINVAGEPFHGAVQHIIISHSAHRASQDQLQPLADGAYCLEAGYAYGLSALSYDLGVALCSGQWIWCWDADSHFNASDISRVLEALSGEASQGQVIWLQPPGDPTRKLEVTIDQLYRGLSPAPDSLLWRADVFDRWGPFDPHLAVGQAFAFEMLLRLVRHSRLCGLPTQAGRASVWAPHELGDVILYADSRATALTWDALPDYCIDNLSIVARKHGPAFAHHLYLECVLPFYYRYRHRLPRGLPVLPQSMPPEPVTLLFTKVQYETSNELTFWNYERHFRGSRGFYLTYLQSSMLANGASSQLSIQGAGQVDVLVSTRTADVANATLMEAAKAAGCATVYALDDDLLTFHEYGDPYTAFRPGQPEYEAMLQTIRSADVVIGYSAPIERSIVAHNPRYVGNEDSIDPAYLPRSAAKPTPGLAVHFGYAGGGYRTEEFQMLRPAIERILREYGDRVRFSFWGMSAEAVGISGAVEYQPFSVHYLEYLERLKTAEFDAVLVPLMAEPTPKRAKNPNKFLEATVANAVGLYSAVPSYQVVRHGLTGLKVENTTEAWYDAMRALLEMPEEQRLRLRTHALDYVRLFYSTPALAHTAETGQLAALLHQKTRDKRLEDGRPLIAFFVPSISGTGGGEIQLWRRLEAVRHMGFQVLVVISSAWADAKRQDWVVQWLDSLNVACEFVSYNAFFTTPYNLDVLPHLTELTELRKFFQQYDGRIALAHSLAFVPAVGQVCSEFGIAHIASIYGIDDDYQFPTGRLPFKYCDIVQSDSMRYAKKWAELLGSDWVCARENAPAPLYELGFDRLYADPAPAPGKLILTMAGTLMARKSQLEVIRAMALLAPAILEQVELHLYGGVDTYPDYGQACRAAEELARRKGATVIFHGHVGDVTEIYQQASIVLSVSTFESFPSAIKEASASGVLVIASRSGGILEMMVDEINCFMVEQVDPERIAEAITRVVGSTPERLLEIRRNAYQLACDEFHPRRTIHDLALGYLLALRNFERANSSASMPGQTRDHRRSRQAKTEAQIIVEPSTHQPASYIPVGGGVWYTVAPQRPNWSGIDVFIATHGRQAIGMLLLRVYSPSGDLLREVPANLEHAYDNSWISFRFPPLANVADLQFRVSFSIVAGSRTTRVSLYEASPAEPKLRHWLRRAGLPLRGNAPFLRLTYTRPTKDA